jgi:phosphoribosylaminoimidazole-succinocarboxamide synthase
MPGITGEGILPPIHQGPNELYAIDEPSLVMVATDRLSAFDVVLPTEIPDKGKILTKLSLWWFDQLSDIVPNHVISADISEFPAPFRNHPALAGRSMWVREVRMFGAECVARNYLSGSATESYKRLGSVCGIELPAGLVEGSELPQPIFTPTTKAAPGKHDEPITYERFAEIIGDSVWAANVRRITLAILRRGNDICRERGVIIADTKVELGRNHIGKIVLADEVLTPDSSRFWLLDEWQPGKPQPSLDKQPIRDWLLKVAHWDKRPETVPEIPEHIVEETRSRYIMAYEKITGERWD